MLPPNQSESSLTEADLTERLRLGNTRLVEDLYEAARRLFDAETDRRSTIEAKAVSLLSAAGLCVTVVSSLVAAMARGFSAPRSHRLIVIVPLVITLIAGVFAALQALRALKVRHDIRQLNEVDVFRPDVLETSDGDDDKRSGAPSASVATDPLEQGRDRSDPESSDRAERRELVGATYWRRYMIVHMTLAAGRNGQINQAKAALVESGQRAFLGFAFGVLTLALILAVVCYLIP